jgi:uncharacterized protein
MMKQKFLQLILRSAMTLVTSGLSATYANSQPLDSLHREGIAVTARPSIHSITLRWAPLTYKVWQAGNQLGYRVERYVVIRNGRMLAEPPRQIIQSSVKPLAVDEWESIVQNNRYGAIAAQALFGDRFEVDLRQNDMFTIVNKVRENEQRFAFALFSADMSPEVAMASGLWVKDTAVVNGEKYLYRIIINSADSLRGSIFIGPDDPYDLPVPLNLQADFKDHFVSLKWDRIAGSPYTAYIIERSENGDAFKNISEAPRVTVSPFEKTDNPYEYATDSLRDSSKTYRYRVKGISPFGEEGPASAVVEGIAIPVVEQVPFIIAAENINNTSIVIQWTFPETSNAAIVGFGVERAPSPEQPFSSLTEPLLAPSTRTFEDVAPNQTNYYRIRAKGMDGQWYGSHDYFAQLVDSVPPATPLALKGTVDNAGKVYVSWNPNSDRDIYGYRVYKAYHESEELMQVTEAPVSEPSFADQITLNTLNENVYYRVMAIDISQNHSLLSEMLKIPLPDLVKPQPPVFLPTSTLSKGVKLSWIPGASEDIVEYRVFRRDSGSRGWVQIGNIRAKGDSVYSYVDQEARPAQTHFYTVVSVDDAGLESEPAHAISKVRIDITLRPAVKWKRPRISREENEIRLSWQYDQQHVQSYRLFRSVDDSSPVLFQSLGGNESGYTDVMTPGRRYSYRIMAVFEDGYKSSLSDELKFVY